jgi:hypothetical protein
MILNFIGCNGHFSTARTSVTPPLCIHFSTDVMRILALELRAGDAMHLAGAM